MARRIFLHIGLPKSGTTFIQTKMWENREALDAQGFRYPGERRLDHWRASQEVRDVSAARLGEHVGTWDRLVGELSAWDGDGMISHEFLCAADAGQAQRAIRALAPAEVHVVLTVRSYILQIPAVWQESLKLSVGEDATFDEFMDRMLEGQVDGIWSWQSQDIVSILRNWASALPPERIHVITVPPPGSRRELLWERWSEATGIDDHAFDADLSYANESLGATQAALLTRVKQQLSEDDWTDSMRHRWLREYFCHQVLVDQRGERFGPRGAYVDRLEQLTAEAAAEIGSGGYSVIGDPAELLGIKPAEGLHPDDVTADQLVDAAAQAIDQMMRDLRRVSGDRNRWRNRAKRLEEQSGETSQP